MELTRERYERFQSLMGYISEADRDLSSVRQGMHVVQKAVADKGNGTVEINATKEVVEALAQILQERDQSFKTRGIVNAVKDFQSNPMELIKRVVSLRPALAAPSPGGPSPQMMDRWTSYMLATFLLSLVAHRGPVIEEREARIKASASAPKAASAPAPKAAASAALEPKPGKKAWKKANDQASTPDYLFENSATLREMPAESLSSASVLLRYLVTFRDRIARDDLAARGEASPHEYEFERLEDRYPLRLLARALECGARISPMDARLFCAEAAGPLDHFLLMREGMEPEVRKAMDAGADGEGLMRRIDRSAFKSRFDPGSTLSESSIRAIIKIGKWFLMQERLEVRSLYGASELRFMSQPTSFFEGYARIVTPEVSKMMAESVEIAEKDRFEGRRVAVEAMAGMVSNYSREADAGMKFKPEVAKHIGRVAQLLDWNIDALDYRRPGRGGGGGGRAQITSAVPGSMATLAGSSSFAIFAGFRGLPV